MMLGMEKAELYNIVLMTVVWLSAMALTVWDFMVIQSLIYRFGAISFIGTLCFTVGVAIRLVARRTLGGRFAHRLARAEGHTLVKHGVYSYVRHPAYLGSNFVDSGIPLLLNSLLGFLLMQLLVPLLLRRIRIEERILIEEFGDEYSEYMRTTKKLIPFIY